MATNRLQTHIYNPKSNTVGLTEMDVLRTGRKTVQGSHQKAGGPFHHSSPHFIPLFPSTPCHKVFPNSMYFKHTFYHEFINQITDRSKCRARKGTDLMKEDRLVTGLSIKKTGNLLGGSTVKPLP